MDYAQINSELLINLVEKYRELYDKNHIKYKNSKYKEQIWSKISKEMGIKDVSEIKKKWTYLRDKFQRELKKRNQPSGSPATPLTTWSHFHNLMFLKDCVRHSVTEGNYSTSTPAKQTSLYDEVNFDELIEDYDEDDEDDQTENYGTTSSSSNTTTNKQAKRKNDDTEIGDILQLIKKKCEKETAEDHIDHFCSFVKHYMKQLPKNIQDEAIGFITNYLIEKQQEFSNK